MRKVWPAIGGFKGGRSHDQECGQPLEDGKSKKIDFPLESPERSVALLTPWFGPTETHFGLLIYRTVRKNISVV